MFILLSVGGASTFILWETECISAAVGVVDLSDHSCASRAHIDPHDFFNISYIYIVYLTQHLNIDYSRVVNNNLKTYCFEDI